MNKVDGLPIVILVKEEEELVVVLQLSSLKTTRVNSKITIMAKIKNDINNAMINDEWTFKNL